MTPDTWNFSGRYGDHHVMNCEVCRDALSAQLDDEDPGIEMSRLQLHLSGCPGCRAFAEGAVTLHRSTRLRPAEPVPDLVGMVLARVETPRRSRPEWARYALFAVALTQLLMALPALLLGDSLGASVHIARELGSWDVALAVGLLYAVWRPERANGMLAFAAALAGTMVVTAMLDVFSGQKAPLSESHHLLEVAGLLLLVVLAQPNWWGVRRHLSPA